MKLESGEGRKEIIMNAPDNLDVLSYIEFYYKCVRCLGTGKLDWINRIIKPEVSICIEKRTIYKSSRTGTPLRV